MRFQKHKTANFSFLLCCRYYSFHRSHAGLSEQEGCKTKARRYQVARVLAGRLTGFESAQPTKHKSPGLRQANKKEEPKPKTLYRYLLEVLQYWQGLTRLGSVSEVSLNQHLWAAALPPDSLSVDRWLDIDSLQVGRPDHVLLPRGQGRLLRHNPMDFWRVNKMWLNIGKKCPTKLRDFRQNSSDQFD